MKISALLLPLALLVLSCNNSNNDNGTAKKENKMPGQVTNSVTPPETNAAPASGTTVTVEGREIKLGGSLLVQKDKDKLQPGADYLVMLTAPGGAGKESMVLNFLLALKTGTYPVVGMSFRRGESPKNEMYGDLLGGKPKLTDFKVNITECMDLGGDDMGGHRWSISGNFEGLVIPAMGLMLMDKTKSHPKEIKIEKGSFSNLTFEDNWEELMNKVKRPVMK